MRGTPARGGLLLAGALALLPAAPRGETALPPDETLVLDEALWGVDLPNAVGRLALAYDPEGAVLYHWGASAAAVLATPDGARHPTRAIALDAPRTDDAELLVDPGHRILVWADRHALRLRVIDLDAGAVAARLDGEAAPGGVDWTLDRANGWIWGADRARRTLTGWSPDLARSVTLPGLRRPARVQASPGGGELLIVDEAGFGRLLSYRTVDGSYREVCRFSPRAPVEAPPRQVGFLDNGDYVAATSAVAAFTPDCAARWRINTDLPVTAFLLRGDTILTLEAWTEKSPLGSARLFETRTGRPLAAAIPTRYGPRSIAWDPNRRRAFVGNDLDGSATIIDVEAGRAAGTLDLGHSVDAVLTDGLTGTRYLLDQLGGNTVYRWRPGELPEAWAALPAPFDAVLDEVGRTLVLASHLYPGVFRVDLDTGERLPTVDLDLPPNRGRAVGDLAVDPTLGLAAVAFPESGGVALADLRTGRQRWAVRLPWLAVGAGEAGRRASLALGRRRVYVAGGPRAAVAALGMNGEELVRTRWRAAPGAEPPPLLYDGVHDRLFLGGLVLDPDTLATRADLAPAGVERVIHAGRREVLALGRAGGADRFLVLDPDTLAVRRAAVLVGDHGPAPRPSWDAAGARLYLADPLGARVFAWDFAPR